MIILLKITLTIAMKLNQNQNVIIRIIDAYLFNEVYDKSSFHFKPSEGYMLWSAAHIWSALDMV